MQRALDRFLIGCAALMLGVLALVVFESAAWVGRPFPGFLVLENRVVPSAGLAHWPATARGAIYQHEITAVDGRPLASAAELHAYVAALPPGTPVTYRFERRGGSRELTVHTRVFDRVDYTLLFGSLLLNGIALGATALMIRHLRRHDMLALGSFSMLAIHALWATTAVDLYGPYRLFRLHAACECFLFAALLHMAAVFPKTLPLVQRQPRLLWIPYAAAVLLAGANQIGLYDPDAYRATHQIAVSLFGLATAFLMGTQLRWYLRPPSFEVRQRVKVVALGAAVSLTAPVLLALGSVVTGGETPQNAMSFTAIFFPVSIGYAAIRHNLLEVDVFVRRTLNYAALTLLATLGWVGLIRLADLTMTASPGSPSGDWGLLVTVLFVVLLLPLRDRVQSVIDRLFFRTAYDFRRVVERSSARLASVVDLRVIADELSSATGDTLHPEGLALYVRDAAGSGFAPFPPGPAPALEPELLPELRGAAGPIDRPEGGLAVPCRVSGELIAVLVLGRPRSGRMYGADDRRLLQTLANQGAVAIENALAMQQLRDLNRDLETKVEERTRELREAHAQLVHREKMASLGQFVAGIAHEINNPLNFIQGNLFCLREYVDVMRRALAAYEDAAREAPPEVRDRVTAARAEADLDELLADVESAFQGCAEGVERSTTLVADLRTFSRLDQPQKADADLEAALDSTLNLLRSKITGLNLVKEYGGIPPVECLAGQLNQVFVNLIANAADAVGPRGTIAIRTRSLPDGMVEIEVEDDGKGIEPEHLDKIFDPFFTTKEVGKGTGLGLSISYGIVNRHGGTIRVDSQPGRGTRFTVRLPVKSSSG